MKLLEIDMASIDLVFIKNNTPHCIKHGAMNKVTSYEDKSGIWRCIHTVSNENLNNCRAGCLEQKTEKYGKPITDLRKVK